MAVIAALAAALAYALAAVLQQRAASQAPADRALRFGLLWNLARRPMWLLGILADVGGFVLQFIALGKGSLILVQPLLVSSLLFALPIGAAVSTHRGISRREWVGALEVVVGLALFLVVASPEVGQADASALGWTVVTTATVVPVVAMVGASLLYAGAVRASLQATAAGAVYGLSAAFTKTVSHALGAAPGVGHAVVVLLRTWQTYGLILTGVVGLILVQTAFQAGPLGWSLPALTVVDPVVSILIGAVAFDESIAATVGAVVAEVVGMALMVLGVTVLAKSPLVPAPVEARDATAEPAEAPAQGARRG